MGCREARGQAPVWEHQFPDLMPVAGAAEMPVGIGATTEHVFVAGTKYINSTTSVMSLVMYDFFSCASSCSGGPPASVAGTGKALGEAAFPVALDKGIREAKAAALIPQVDTEMKAFITGTLLLSTGDMRVLTGGFTTNNATSPPTLELMWSATESLPGVSRGVSETPVGIAVLSDIPTSDLPLYVAVVSEVTGYSTGKDVNVRVYNASTGVKILEQYWTSSGSADDVPVGVALHSSSSTTGVNVIVGVTTPVPGSSPPRTQAVVLGWRAESDLMAPIPTGTPMTGSGLTIGQTTTQSDVLKAVTSQAGAEVSPNVIAFAAHRTDTNVSPASQDFLTARIDVIPHPAPASDELTELWQITYDDMMSTGSDIDIPVAMKVFDTTPLDNTHSSLRIAVTGTTQAAGATTTDFATVCHRATSGELTWWANYDNTNNGANTSNNDYPTSMAFAPFAGEMRLYIAGATDNVGGTGAPNYDFLSFYYEPGDTSPSPRQHPWIPDGSIPALPWSNGTSDGFDEVTCITARGMSIGGTPYYGIFKAGRSAHPITGFDWVTARLADNP